MVVAARFVVAVVEPDYPLRPFVMHHLEHRPSSSTIAAVTIANSTATSSGAARELYYYVGAIETRATMVVASFRAAVITASASKAKLEAVAADFFVIVPLLSTTLSFQLFGLELDSQGLVLFVVFKAAAVIVAFNC